MQKNINDTIKLCKRYIVIWFVSIALIIPGIIAIVFNVLTLDGSSSDPAVTEDFFLRHVIITVIVGFIAGALGIAMLVIVILIIVNVTKLQSVLGNSYQTYFILSIVGIFIPIVFLVACFLIKRDLSEYKPPEESKPDVVQPKVEEMSVSKQ